MRRINGQEMIEVSNSPGLYLGKSGLGGLKAEFAVHCGRFFESRGMRQLEGGFREMAHTEIREREQATRARVRAAKRKAKR